MHACCKGHQIDTAARPKGDVSLDWQAVNSLTMLVVAIAKEAQDLVLLLQWQQQALRLLRRLLVTPSFARANTCFFCNGNNKHEKQKKYKKR